MQEIMSFLLAHWVLSLGCFVFLCLAIGVEFWGRLGAVASVSPQKLVMMLNREGAAVIDVREQGDFIAGHIIGAINMPLVGFSEQVAKHVGLKKVKDKNAVVVTCATGSSSPKAIKLLSAAGYNNVYSLMGGMNAWQQAALPTDK